MNITHTCTHVVHVHVHVCLCTLYKPYTERVPSFVAVVTRDYVTSFVDSSHCFTCWWLPYGVMFQALMWETLQWFPVFQPAVPIWQAVLISWPIANVYGHVFLFFSYQKVYYSHCNGLMYMYIVQICASCMCVFVCGICMCVLCWSNRHLLYSVPLLKRGWCVTCWVVVMWKQYSYF